MSDQQLSSLRAEQVRALYLQAPISNLTTIVVSTLYGFVLRAHLDSALPLAWMLTMWSAAGYRIVLWHRYRRHGAQAPSVIWLRRYRDASFAVGCAWSLAMLFLGDMSDPIVIAALFMLVFGVTSSAVAILSTHLPSFVLYVAPQLAMLGFVLLRQGVVELSWLVVALGVYALMLTLFARNADRLFRGHVHLATQNQALVRQLNVENARREEIIQERTEALRSTNQTLEAEISERKKAEAALRAQERSLRRLANHDPLTDLPNRLLMIDRLEHAIQRAHRAGTGFALLFIDLDHFKEVNDSLGHTAGDQLLKAVANRLVASLREGDTVARLGGDEFVVIAEGTSTAMDTSVIAEMIQSAFSAPLDITLGDFCITPSIGISLYPQDGVDTETLLRNADAAMYRAKADGRKAYRFYSADMTEQFRESFKSPAMPMARQLARQAPAGPDFDPR